MNYIPREGAFFTYLDVEDARRVCLLGGGMKRKLFYFRDPIGQQVKIGGQWFTILGVMEDKVVSATGKRPILSSAI